MKKFRISFWFLYFTSLFFLFYLSLIVVDIIIPKITVTKPVKSVEADSKYILDLDQKKKELLSQGFVKVITLNAVLRDREFKNIIKKNSAVGIGLYPNKNIIYCDEGYKLQTYRSDRFGFRNYNRQYDKEVNVALFGDSFVHGGCVPTKDTISHVMSEVSNTLGFGISGSHPIHYAATINIMLPRVLPKKAGIAFYNNDFNDSDRSNIFYKFYVKNPKKALAYFQSNGDLSPNIYEYYKNIYDLYNKKDPLVYKKWPLSFFDLLKKIEKYLLLNNVRAILYQYFPKIIPLSGLSPSSKIAIDVLIAACDNYDCDPFITYLPHSNYWNPNYAHKYYKAQLKQYSEANNLKFIDLSEIVDSNNKEDFGPLGGHYSIESYRRVGRYLTQQIQE